MLAATLVAAATAAMVPPEALAWDVRCEITPGAACPDPFASARTTWQAHPRAEHRRLLEMSLDVSGLPLLLKEEFDLKVFVDELQKVRTDEDVEYASIRPALLGPTKAETRTVTIQMFANLPDFSYTLWDWASGNERCPPDASNTDPFDCHNYETHIGWLNSNHMLPQSRRWYEHLHALAMERAEKCKVEYDRTPAEDLDRMRPYLEACEKLALVLEGVGHHYLQDSWAIGHMWERWGGTEPDDFGRNRALGFFIGFFTGTIHGAKAVLDEHYLTSPYGPWDDPMNAPNPLVAWRDAGARQYGVGDMFIDSLFGLDDSLPDSPAFDYKIQRRALLGCAVSGLREVYAATAQLHGPMTSALAAEADLGRSVKNDSCWAQRVTNKALAEGFGLNMGPAPVAQRLSVSLLPLQASMTLLALISQGTEYLLDPSTLEQFQLDAAYATALALAKGANPLTEDDVDLASGGLPALAAIDPNSRYERGNASLKGPPSPYADPFLPWPVLAATPSTEPGKYLNLTFADANAGERCAELDTADLEAWRDSAMAAVSSDTYVEARCGQCVAMVAPHLRRGRPGNHDRSREAYCALVEPQDSRYVYTDEDPAGFTGTEPKTFEALAAAAREWCGCAGDDGGEEPPPPPPPPPAEVVSLFGSFSYRLDATDCATGLSVTAGSGSASLPRDGTPLSRSTGWPGIAEAALRTEVVNIAFERPNSTSLKATLTNSVGPRPETCTGDSLSAGIATYDVYVPVRSTYAIADTLSMDSTNSNVVLRQNTRGPILYSRSVGNTTQGSATGTLEAGYYTLRISVITTHKGSYDTGAYVLLPDPVSTTNSVELTVSVP
jgi:hypothetical protein